MVLREGPEGIVKITQVRNIRIFDPNCDVVTKSLTLGVLRPSKTQRILLKLTSKGKIVDFI